MTMTIRNSSRFAALFMALWLLAACASKPEPTLSSPQPRYSHAQQCLALAMYWEARGEGRQGMAAVGHVVLNRVADPRFPNDACAVVHQGGETPPCQFSWWCDGKSDRPTHAALWHQSLDLAGELMRQRHSDPTRGALFFHNTSIRNPWRYARTARIGNHVFYR